MSTIAANTQVKTVQYDIEKFSCDQAMFLIPIVTHITNSRYDSKIKRIAVPQNNLSFNFFCVVFALLIKQTLINIPRNRVIKQPKR